VVRYLSCAFHRDHRRAPPDTLRCNTVGALAGDESVGRILSADSDASAAPGVIVSEGKIILA
jgi:hypothetical protein